LTLGGVALAGLVQTQELTNVSNTLAQATASKAATGTVITVTGNGNSGSVTVGTGGTIALGSDAGKVTTNATFSQLSVGNGSGLTNIPLAALQTVPLTNNHTSAVTLGGNLTVNGTANIAPNQTASSGASVMTRDLGDARYVRSILDPAAAFLANTSLIDSPVGTQNYCVRLSTFNGRVGFYVPEPPFSATNTVILTRWMATNAVPYSLQVRFSVQSSTNSQISAFTNVTGTAGAGTNAWVLTNSLPWTAGNLCTTLDIAQKTNTTYFLLGGEVYWQ
jgi:hypothetical protein